MIKEHCCPYCDKPMEYESDGFMDCFNHTTGHYTINIPFFYCNECDYQIDEGELYDE